MDIVRLGDRIEHSLVNVIGDNDIGQHVDIRRGHGKFLSGTYAFDSSIRQIVRLARGNNTITCLSSLNNAAISLMGSRMTFTMFRHDVFNILLSFEFIIDGRGKKDKNSAMSNVSDIDSDVVEHLDPDNQSWVLGDEPFPFPLNALIPVLELYGGPEAVASISEASARWTDVRKFMLGMFHDYNCFQ